MAKEVKEKLKTFHREAADGLFTEDITFEQCVNLWFNDYKNRLERSAQDDYKYTLRIS